MRFASLGSGSQGNALVVEVARTCLMLDCGFSLRETVSRLARVGLEPSDLRGIIVTHEHADHGEGVFPFARRFGVPVWLTHGTLVALRETLADADEECSFNLIDSQCSFPVDDLLVQPFTVPHDAREPVQYVLSDGRADWVS
jgi:phosphoribosyl 1,2-cyclic phosphodiesterase